MKLHRSILLLMGILFLAAPTVRAAEPYLEFVNELRRHDYHDYALIYLEKLEKRADVPADIKEVIPFEKGITLVDGARREHSPEGQTRQLDLARGFLEQFLKASPNHPNAGKANTELANVIVGKGKVEVMQSKSPGNVAQKGEFQKKARVYFAEARQVFQAAHDRYKEAYDKENKFIDKKEKARYDAREEKYRHYIQAQLNLAVLIYEEAQTYDKGSPDNKKMLTDAANNFSTIHAKYRQQVAGLYARMWEGKCFEEEDDIVKALGLYNELLGHDPGKTGPLKNLQDRVRHFRLICLNREQRKDYQVAVQEGQEWLKENRNLASTRTGLGIQWELVRALELLGKKEETSDADKTRMFQQALTIARTINRYPGEFKDVSQAAISRLMVLLDREPGDPKDFATAFGVARNLIQDISKRMKEIQDAGAAPERAKEREKMLADLQPVLKEAARILHIALTVATPKDDAKEVNQARYFLSYVYFSTRDGALDRSYDAAILAEYIAHKSVKTQSELALDAAYLAQAAYIQAYHHEVQEGRAGDFKRIIAVCNFITGTWSTSDKANDARMALGRVYNEIGQPGEAAKWLMEVPESAPQYLEAQLDAGNAWWYYYLSESIKPEAERKPKEELDGFLKQSQDILRTALAKFEAPLPTAIAQVDDTRLGNLTRAKLNYSQILNGSGDFKGALAMLTEGHLSIVAAVASPEGIPRPAKGSIKSRQYAGIVYQVLLRTYVGLQDLDKARETMRELEKIVGTGGGGASLTKIYLDLGKELQKEVERLQAARDPRLAEVLKSFETFLEDMSKRKEGQDFNSLVWVAETYRALGEGLQQGDSAKAEGYFGRAVTALQQLLDEEKNKPGFIPSGGVLGVKLKIVMCKRRQKDFEEAHKQLIAVLEEKSKALDVQEEAARLFQDWAASGDLDKWAIAIEGGAANKKNKEDKRVWGWFGLAEKLKSSLLSNRNPEYEQKYLDASYSVADCWFKSATAQSTNASRKKQLTEAYKAVERPAVLIPHLGGGDTWTKFNKLYRQIQQEMLDLGMEQMRGKEVVDFARRGRLNKEEQRAAAKKEAQGDDVVAAENGGAVNDKPKSKPKTSKAEAKPQPGTNWTPLIVGLVLIGGGGGGAYFYLSRGKKKKRRPVVSVGGDEPNFGEFQAPAAPQVKKRQNVK